MRQFDHGLRFLAVVGAAREEKNMSEQIEIIKQVKLTAAQRIAVIAAANADGVMSGVNYDVRETLRYLGLVQQSKQYTKAELEKRTEEAWKSLRQAVASRDAKKAEDAIGVIRSERWDLERSVWRLTGAADEYLLKGRVIVTVGSRNEADTQKRLRA